MSVREISESVEQELLAYPPLTRRLLANRGIENSVAAEAFLNPSYETHIHDPFLMMNLEQAVDQIYGAIKANEKICIFADYDCDGIPGAVMWDDFFKTIKFTNYQIYIPDRHKEGYGLGIESIKEIFDAGAKLLVTLDLGITAVEEVEYAKTLPLPIIITDHHLPQEVLPDTLIVNPKQPGDMYPDNMLCGSGVAWKVIQGFIKKYGAEFEIPIGFGKWLLDMAGLATLADMVPLRLENRAIAHFGLKVLRKTRRPGLLSLLRKANIASQSLQEDDVTFSICPKLNAASRMDSPMRAFELLSASDATAGAHADHLIGLNDERKILVANIMKNVKKTLSHEERVVKPVIVIGDPSWRAGILGLVAGKIVEEFGKPAFVWGKEGSEHIKGSCRSDGSVNLVELMQLLPPGAVTEFGGHAGAGGFSAAGDEIHFLEERLATAYEKVTKIEMDAGAERDYETTLSLDDVGVRTFAEIDRLAPFGAGNPKPVFLFQNISVADARTFGKAKDHLELRFVDSRGRSVKAIQFFKTPDDYAVLAEQKPINLYAFIEKSVFGRREEVRLRIVDVCSAASA